jgi:hypothetical protein
MTADELQAVIDDVAAKLTAAEQKAAALAAQAQAAPRPEQLEALRALARRLDALAAPAA